MRNLYQGHFELLLCFNQSYSVSPQEISLKPRKIFETEMLQLQSIKLLTCHDRKHVVISLTPSN